MVKRLSKNIDRMVIKANQLNAFSSPEDIFSTSLQILLVIFMIFMNDITYLSIFMPVILFPGILFRELRSSKLYWIIILIFSGTFYLVLDLVGYVPNHKHIFAYVTLAVTISLFLSDKINSSPLDFLKSQTRVIIGLCFLFATIGKFLAPEFLNSLFFDFTNTTDPRFFGSTSTIGGVNLELLKENEMTFASFLKSNNPHESFILHGVDDIKGFSQFLTIWTIFIEGMIALSFLVPPKLKVSRFRNLFLVIFIITTYPVATVTGFAIILAYMGFIQSLEERRLTTFSVFYLGVLLLLPLNYFPFTRLFALIS